MTQLAKVIDVTRSFIPVDPNSYPENLHATGQEDAPEQRIPVVPYMGYNFLPTSYGYKSYFGMNAKVDILTLAPNKADAVFMFQNITYKNVLIALCDTGIWYKASGATGGWVQAVALTAPAAGTFYEWTYTVIKNKLYVFKANGAVYYKIETDVTPSGLKFTTVTPTFISLIDQLGMFRLGARLAFWDTNNAISWANPDDLADFTPAVLTGANVTTFNSITGKIAAIRPHGTGAIAYASKSVTQLQVNAAETFFVKALPILTNTGTAYSKQSVEGTPDSMHFAYTDTAIYKITNNNPEIIIPEVFDYFGSLTGMPVYLKMLGGRHLFFNTMDPKASVGKAQFAKRVIPPSSLTFPGGFNSLDTIHTRPIDEIDLCDTINKIPINFYTEQQAAGNAAVPASMRKDGTSLSPVYTCYISDAKGMDPEFNWVQNPCGTAKITTGFYLPAPDGENGTLSALTTDKTNKRAETGDEAYIDGWTMERFIAYQTAIWKAQQKGITKFLTKLASFSEGASKTELKVSACAPSTTVGADCLIGRFPSQFSEPKFGFNFCSFWLTRYAIAVDDVKNNTTLAVTCSNGSAPCISTGYRYNNNNLFDTVDYASGDALAAAIQAAQPVGGTQIVLYVPYTGATTNIAGNQTAAGYSTVGYLTRNGVGGSEYVIAWFAASAGKIINQQATGICPGLPTVEQVYAAGTYDKVSTQNSHNFRAPVVLAPIPETAYCEITGWRYTDKNGVKQTTASTACTNVNDSSPQVPASTTSDRRAPQDAVQPAVEADGSFCGVPLQFPKAVTGVTNPIWEDQTVVYPGTSFLTQDGSVAPINPTFYGALVYDLHLKKWGKMKADYKQLLDYSPINSAQSGIVNFDNFGILAGALKDDGFIYIFDNFPADSRITWGKIGYYRLGVTDPEIIRVDFRTNFTGSVINEVSIDGIHVASDLVSEALYAGVQQAFVYPKYTGKWHNVTIKGRFDISYMEFNGVVKGRR